MWFSLAKALDILSSHTFYLFNQNWIVSIRSNNYSSFNSFINRCKSGLLGSNSFLHSTLEFSKAKNSNKVFVVFGYFIALFTDEFNPCKKKSVKDSSEPWNIVANDPYCFSYCSTLSKALKATIWHFFKWHH